ncbi:hypothetical protein [Halorubrum lipolyticum]|uniref:Uncharacterized protein n=1 Tax=Halorubrum lipolyticum DSM 21995 TaxID=1227482 RepID=M0P2Y5_9EURY|nr:hypothetical protein [Halorubrum lipolyticum]EMA64446.1 hypothetical protein C469_00926 [Halorubrum lipolyticum DSM 21995]
MDGPRRTYRRLDEWVSGFSRGGYALLVGVAAALSSFAVSLALGAPDYIFAVGIGLSLTAFNYWFDPNHREE